MKGNWHADVRFHRGARPCLGGGRKRGQDDQALGRSRGGFSTKIDLKTDFGAPSRSLPPALRRKLRKFQTGSNTVPMPKLSRQSPPSDVVDHEILQDFRSFLPLSPRRERNASNTFKTIVQSSSVMVVSMVGPPKADCP
jgi:hypothetical protein